MLRIRQHFSNSRRNHWEEGSRELARRVSIVSWGRGREWPAFYTPFFYRKKEQPAETRRINMGWGRRDSQPLRQSIGRLFIAHCQKISWAKAQTMLISDLKCISSYWGEQSRSRSLPYSLTAIMEPSYAQHNV